MIIVCLTELGATKLREGHWPISPLAGPNTSHCVRLQSIADPHLRMLMGVEGYVSRLSIREQDLATSKIQAGLYELPGLVPATRATVVKRYIESQGETKTAATLDLYALRVEDALELYSQIMGLSLEPIEKWQ